MKLRLAPASWYSFTINLVLENDCGYVLAGIRGDISYYSLKTQTHKPDCELLWYFNLNIWFTLIDDLGEEILAALSFRDRFKIICI